MARKNVVVIRSMLPYNDANYPFGQGNIVAVIPDARDVGVQLHANDAGAAFFTLPVDHWALPLINPLNQHYEIQKWDSGAYVTIQSGIVTDYDAGANEVVINGVDYMTALNKYYTPLHGPELGAKAIPNKDTTAILSTTPQAVIEAAIARDRSKASEGYAIAKAASVYPNAGKVAIFDGSPRSGSPYYPTGTRDALAVTYEEVGGVKTGAVILSGSMYIWRDPATTLFQDGETGEWIESNFSIGTSSSAKGKIGLVISANPGGSLVNVSFDVYIAAASTDIGISGTGYGSLPFSIKLRPVSNYNAADEVHTGTNLTRTMSILSEGVTYEFYATPYYYGNLSPAATSVGGTGNADYNQYIWGQSTRAPESVFTAGLQTNTLPNAVSELFDTSNSANILERDKDFPGVSPAPKTLIAFTNLTQTNTASSTAKHPYVTAGQGPVDFLRELSDIEMGSRTDGSKVIFNYYGVPGTTPDGKKLIVNHSVSPDSQATLIYPGQIRDFNVTNRLSAKTNSARVIPTTDFLIGASTEGAGGAKTQGVVKVAAGTTSASPALPKVVSQSGFLSAEAAGNYAQGEINDFGTDADVQTISVSLRTEQFGPIGVSGTPKLGETVRVVVRRKNVTIGGDELSGLYNVGGMQWVAKIDGTESLTLYLVKPNKFKGPAITWERKPGPKPEPAAAPYVGRPGSSNNNNDTPTWKPTTTAADEAGAGSGYMWSPGQTGGATTTRTTTTGLPTNTLSTTRRTQQ